MVERQKGCRVQITLWKLQIVFVILTDVLAVDASQHDMIDTCSALLPYLSGHIIASYIA